MLSASLMNNDMNSYMKIIYQHKTWWEIAYLSLSHPFASFAIFSIRKWSYPVFLTVALVDLYLNFQTWRLFPNILTVPLLVVLTLCNIAFVSYFLLNAVRAPYFNPRVRWWEVKPRFLVNFTARIRGPVSKQKCLVIDISEGGIFVKTNLEFALGDTVKVELAFLNRIIEVQGKVVHCGKARIKGYGIQFYENDKATMNSIGKVIEAIEAMGFATRAQKPTMLGDFKRWVKALLKTGRGWVPEALPPNPRNVISLEVSKARYRERRWRKMLRKQGRTAA